MPEEARALTNDGPVLVVGGTGMLGGQVVTELLSRGKRVRALVRPASNAAALEQAGVEISRGDMMDPASLVRAMDGVDAVVTTAAGYTRHSKGDSAEIDTTGNRNLVDAARHIGVRRFVLTSILTCDQTPQVPHPPARSASWRRRGSQDRAAWCHLEGGYAAAVEHHEPITVSAAKDTGVVAKSGDGVLDDLRLRGVGFGVGDVDVVATEEPNAQLDLCHGQAP